MSREKYKILLAEDDKYISRAYTDGLGQAGFEVIVALDGEEALRKITSESPDILLLDLIMPVKNGFEVLEEIRMNSDIGDVPVIILSNLGQETDMQKAKDLGAVDYLIKANFSMEQVVSKVKENLAKIKK